MSTPVLVRETNPYPFGHDPILHLADLGPDGEPRTTAVCSYWPGSAWEVVPEVEALGEDVCRACSAGESARVREKYRKKA